MCMISLIVLYLLQVARSLVQPPVITAYSDHVFTEDTPVYCIDVSIEPEGPVLITCQLAGGKVDEIHALLQVNIHENVLIKAAVIN